MTYLHSVSIEGQLNGLVFHYQKRSCNNKSLCVYVRAHITYTSFLFVLEINFWK